MKHKKLCIKTFCYQSKLKPETDVNKSTEYRKKMYLQHKNR